MIVTIDTDKKEIRITGLNTLRSIGDLIDAINQHNMEDYHLLADDRRIIKKHGKKKDQPEE